MDPADPYIRAWVDQFGALIRDKARAMMAAVEASGFTTLAHFFRDPSDGSPWRIVYEDGDFFLVNLEDGSDPDSSKVFRLDLEALGV